MLVLAVAAVLTALGIVGFFQTGFDDFAHHDTGVEILGFEVNPLHNLVNLSLGIIGLFAWVHLRTAITYGALLLIGYGAAFIYGLSAVGEEWDVLSLNKADSALHLALAAVGALIVVVGYLETRRDRGRIISYFPDEEIDLRETVNRYSTPPAKRTPGPLSDTERTTLSRGH